jgi:thiopeptide-type bacteriocin biosynthesis protein
MKEGITRNLPQTRHNAAVEYCIAPSGFFVFRTPLLPLSALTALSDSLAAPAVVDDSQLLENAIDHDFISAVKRLQQYVAQPAIREALFVASPSLDEAIRTKLTDQGFAGERGILNAVIRYVARMAGRPTPFGLFSGCSVGQIGSETQLRLESVRAYRRHTRLDMHYLSALCEALSALPEMRARLQVRPNSGLYTAAGDLRYAEFETDPVTRSRAYSLVSVETTEYLQATLSRADLGAHPAELAQGLVAEYGNITREDAGAYIEDLIDSQILESDLAPAITSEGSLDETIETLQRYKVQPVAQVLEGARAAMQEMDTQGVGVDPENYISIASRLSGLPAAAELARLFQIDLYKPADASLGGEPLAEMQRAVALLARMATSAEPGGLKRFRDAFVERYGPRLEGPQASRGGIPLVEALDEETGIGFASSIVGTAEPSPLLDGLIFPPPASEDTQIYGRREQCLLQGIMRAESARNSEWSLTTEDIEALSSKTMNALPDAFALIATLAARSSSALVNGEFRLFVKGAAGPSGAELLGRFCQGDEGIRRGVQQHLAAEEAGQPQAVFAEIVHLPEGRMGNIICRPVLRGYEIPYMGRSGIAKSRQIPISDLSLTISNGRFVVFSERLGKEVIPRMTAAHNHGTAALGIYRFLCALQQEHGRSLAWNWGALQTAPFLPRVTSGRLILSLARWNLSKEQIASLQAETVMDRYQALQSLRKTLGLPRWFGLAEGDNVLPVDADHTLHVESFVQLIKNRDAVVLVEFFPALDELVVEGPEGRFVHELIVPFLSKTARVQAEAGFRPASRRMNVQRSFLPGSEWLFAKLYVGTATADVALKEVVAPVIQTAKNGRILRSWFFIRYGDPQWHIRLRINGDPLQLSSQVLPALYEAATPLLNSGCMWKLQIDTYEREVERYGGEHGIALAEKLFEIDSDAVLEIVRLLDARQGDDARWRLTLRGMHLLMVDMGMDLVQRLGLIRTLRHRFGEEHHINVEFERQLGARFRSERGSLQDLLALPAGAGHQLDAGFELLARRSDRVQSIARSLDDLARAGRLALSLPELTASFLHMHANRLLRSEQRAQELVLYDFLLRIYESEDARRRKGR